MTTYAPRVKDIIAEYVMDFRSSIHETVPIHETDSLKNDLNLDSLDIVELVMDLEDTFNLVILDEEFATVRTVQDVIDFVDTQKGVRK